MTRRVLAAMEDLLFKSKVSETASHLGIEAKFPRSPERLLAAIRDSPPDLLVLDLNSDRFDPLALLREIEGNNFPTVGFLSHVQKDLAVAAREAGCDRIMARSAFTRDLPRILAGGDAADTNYEAGVG